MVVPALPYMFDEPVEEAVDWTFTKGYELLYRNKPQIPRDPSVRHAGDHGSSKIVEELKNKTKKE